MATIAPPSAFGESFTKVRKKPPLAPVHGLLFSVLVMPETSANYWAHPFMKLFSILVLASCAVVLPPLHAEDVVVLRLEKEGAPLPPVVIELFEADAPKHSTNFKQLVSKGFYLKSTIHRVLPGALVQMGDPLSRKKGSPDIGTGGPGYTLPPEIRHKHSTGAVGMGRLPDQINPGRRSNGSQFYITLKPLPELDGTQTIFGRVTQGLETFERIGKGSVDTNEAPLERITVIGTKVVSKAVLEQELSQQKEGNSKGFWGRLFGKLPRLF